MPLRLPLIPKGSQRVVLSLISSFSFSNFIIYKISEEVTL